MREDFLHHIWLYKKFDTLDLLTTDHQKVVLKKVGQLNTNSGPDFFNAQLYIEDQLWAGNVEIHLKSSDWYAHHHETDQAYDNVILHVVWEHDVDIFRRDGTAIPTLILKDYTPKPLLGQYQKLMHHSKSWINCESDFATIEDFILNNWLERLYIKRLEQKSGVIYQLLKTSKNDWEAVLYKMLLKNFGLKVNGEAFFSLAQSIDFTIIKKVKPNAEQLEALLFGQAHLFEKEIEDAYFINQKAAYRFLKQKFKLENSGVLPIQFFRLRPPNFPTIRLSQFANLYHQKLHLFSEIQSLKTLNEFYKFFNIETSTYWKTHYNFGKTSILSKKVLSNNFIDLLLINTVIPLKFAYAKTLGQEVDDEIFNLISEIKIEKNSIVNKFLSLRKMGKTALQSQALLELKTNFCDKNKCLNCAVGHQLLHE